MIDELHKVGGRGQCTRCGEWHNNVSYHEANECKQDYFSIYNYAKLKGIDLDDKKESMLKVGDIVILKSESAPDLYKDGIPFDSEQYKQIHQENIKGKIIAINEIKNHYCWGEYTNVEWENGHISNCIEVGWIQKV